MKRIRVLGLVTWSLLTVGCSGGDDEIHEAAVDPDVEDRTPYENLRIASDTAEGFEEGGVRVSPIPVQGEQGPADVTVDAPVTVTGQLRAIAEGAPPGTVTLTEYGPGTEVLIKIDRYTPGTTLVASLVEGQCEETGEVVTPIGDLTVGPEGFATLTERISLPIRPLLDGRHSVRINTPGQDAPEFVLACTNLPVVENVETP